ncbi:hypothetical protein ANCCEY_08426 [Ancylostoma ceylanicum]|uniref:Uncharacterized protein n=1 Tax=Ancylostoma ceylanicum TaxID=53326 RepID=A0A0D6LK83_9BILA|nr:hypothetical protein ANCCEY_08426 [Ancylostoma ceylanicum]
MCAGHLRAVKFLEGLSFNSHQQLIHMSVIFAAQQYRLGKWLRARYGKFLGDRFDRHEVFVRSSDYNRTLMSAQANMAGEAVIFMDSCCVLTYYFRIGRAECDLFCRALSSFEVGNMGDGIGLAARTSQQYRLGKWLRARYGKFLGDRFDRHEVFVRSSDYNRTLMSAQANMAGEVVILMESCCVLPLHSVMVNVIYFAGLFPPSKSEMWETGLAWQPVPVHSFPKSIDKVL